jgi:pimeloyl-ACP methyl ester carboxylesterase
MSSGEPNPNYPSSEISYTRLSPPTHSNDKNAPHTSIVFLHGVETSHIEFSRITPFLSEDYELILVDLPGHSGSKDMLPFSFDNAINALSHLISTKIAGGRAHVVGVSLGGFVGLELSRRRPELVLSLFCTGCAPFRGLRRWLMSQSRLIAGATIVLGRLATDAVFWSSVGLEPLPGLREEMRKNQSMPMLTAAYAACASMSVEDLAAIQGVRIAIVAGGKRQDSVEDAREGGRVLQCRNPKCKAFVVREAVHLWDLQLPETFAQGVRAWVDESDMPKEFQPLN